MATKKESKEDVEEKEPKESTSKKTTTTRKSTAKKEEPAEKKTEAKEEKPAEEKEDKPKIIKSSEIELPKEKPAEDPKIVVPHKSAARADKEVEIISAEDVMKDDLEYDFETHEIKPYKGPGLTSHDMHKGKYGIIEDVLKPKKKK